MLVKRMLSLGALVLLGLCACGSGPSSTSGVTLTGPINIGLPFGYTGQHAVLGSDWANGAAVAANLINANGGIMGRHVNLIPVDDSLDAVDAVPAIRRMLAVDDVSASVGLAALDYIDALPILNSAHMVSFTKIGSPALDQKVQPYSFSLGPSDALEGSAMVYLAQQRGYHKLALVFDSAAGAQTFPPAIHFAAQKLNMQIVSEPAVPESAASYTGEIEQVLQSKPDVVLMQVEPTQAGAFFNEWKSLGGTNIPIIATDEAQAATWGAVVGADEINNHVVSVQSYSGISGVGGKLFIDTFQQTFNRGYGYNAVPAYDGVTLAALSMIAAHSNDPTVYVNYVTQVTALNPSATTCYTFATCASLLNQGQKIKYLGVSSPLVFNQYHRVSSDFGFYRPPSATGQSPVLLGIIPALKLVGLY